VGRSLPAAGGFRARLHPYADGGCSCRTSLGSGKPLWRASGPKSPEGQRGALTSSNADDFLETSSGTQPKTLPANLDICVTFAGSQDGTGDVFNIRKPHRSTPDSAATGANKATP
jgi:hypothetical protein